MKQTTDLPFDTALLEELISLMWRASDAILEVYRSTELNTEVKGDGSPITEADFAAHGISVKGLS